MIPYWRNEENNELYKDTRTLVRRRCLTLKNIPQILESFLESSLRWYFQLRFSSKRRPRSYCDDFCFVSDVSISCDNTFIGEVCLRSTSPINVLSCLKHF